MLRKHNLPAVRFIRYVYVFFLYFLIPVKWSTAITIKKEVKNMLCVHSTISWIPLPVQFIINSEMIVGKKEDNRCIDASLTYRWHIYIHSFNFNGGQFYWNQFHMICFQAAFIRHTWNFNEIETHLEIRKTYWRNEQLSSFYW